MMPFSMQRLYMSPSLFFAEFRRSLIVHRHFSATYGGVTVAGPSALHSSSLALQPKLTLQAIQRFSSHLLL